MVERGPEKAGVGGSIPSLGINLSNELQDAAFSKRNPFSFLLLFLHSPHPIQTAHLSDQLTTSSCGAKDSLKIKENNL